MQTLFFFFFFVKSANEQREQAIILVIHTFKSELWHCRKVCDGDTVELHSHKSLIMAGALSTGHGPT